MAIVVWINSSSAPFLDDICARLKPYETRSKNMLGALVGQRVIFAESARGARLARCSGVIKSVLTVTSPEQWEALRPMHRVPVGNMYDWKPETKIKYLYEFANIRILRPFRIPEGIPHGRSWMEYSNERKAAK